MARATSGHGKRPCLAIVDSQPLFRAGVAHLLSSRHGVEVVAEGQSAMDAIAIAAQHLLDIMLIDLAIPGGAPDMLSTLSRMSSATRLVVLTASEREEDVSSALRQGARGYLLKTVDDLDLIAALRAVMNGEVYLTPALGARLFARSGSAAAPQVVPAVPGTDLTHREAQILSQVSIGATNKEIARQLNISEKTVKYYMTSIMQKLQVRNRVEAVVAMRGRARNIA